MAEEKKVPLVVQITVEQRRLIDAEAVRLRSSLSYVVREALECAARDPKCAMFKATVRRPK